jgi:hypothetical protein
LPVASSAIARTSETPSVKVTAGVLAGVSGVDRSKISIVENSPTYSLLPASSSEDGAAASATETGDVVSYGGGYV